MRPTGKGSLFCDYVYDKRYATDRPALCRSYQMLENDLKTLLEYIEPNDDNCKAYSHRTYELLLRAATEFETNCKRILVANNYPNSGNPDITDYYKINQPTKLSDYEVRFEAWSPKELILKPFAEWSRIHTLCWYQSYNNAKHDRNKNFKEASLENLFLAITGVFVIIFAQFGINVFNSFHRVNGFISDEEDFLYDESSLFSIKEPKWSESERYDFNWDVLSKQTNPFECYNF